MSKRQKIPHDQRLRIYKRDDHRCLKRNTTENLTIDHIKPLHLGGDYKDSNLQTLCFTCNGQKGSKYWAGLDYRNNKTGRAVREIKNIVAAIRRTPHKFDKLKKFKK